jgi:hypothetical protein
METRHDRGAGGGGSGGSGCSKSGNNSGGTSGGDGAQSGCDKFKLERRAVEESSPARLAMRSEKALSSPSEGCDKGSSSRANGAASHGGHEFEDESARSPSSGHRSNDDEESPEGAAKGESSLASAAATDHDSSAKVDSEGRDAQDKVRRDNQAAQLRADAAARRLQPTVGETSSGNGQDGEAIRHHSSAAPVSPSPPSGLPYREHRGIPVVPPLRFPQPHPFHSHHHHHHGHHSHAPNLTRASLAAAGSMGGPHRILPPSSEFEPRAFSAMAVLQTCDHQPVAHSSHLSSDAASHTEAQGNSGVAKSASSVPTDANAATSTHSQLTSRTSMPN